MKKYLFINQTFEELQKEAFSSKRKQLKRLIEQADSYFYEKHEITHPQKSTTYMGVAIANLSLSYLITKQNRYLEEAKRWIDTVVSYEKWGNAHLVNVDLSASWIMFGLSLGYSWLYDDLSEEERNRYKEKLILQSNIMYDFKIETEGKGWSSNYWQNHNWINLAGLATCGYALRNEYPQAEKFINIAKENFEIVYDVMADDGSDYEGVVYWRYGVIWLYIYADLLNKEEKINYFKTNNFLKNTFYYRLYQSMPNLEEIANFGDCHDRRSGHSSAVYYKVASEYNNGHAQYLGNYVTDNLLYKEQFKSGIKPGILPEAFLEFLWYDDKIEEEKFQNLPLVKHFTDLGLIILRSSWEKNSIHMSFKAGHPGGKKQWEKLWELKEKGYNCFGLSHQHPDNNSFILNAYSSFLTIDDGYNRNCKASNHNVVIVDEKGYDVEDVNDTLTQSAFSRAKDDAEFNPLKDFVSEITYLREEEQYVIFSGECSKMYSKELKLTRNERTFIYSKNGYFIMVDNLESEVAHTYKNIIHTDTVAKKINDNLYEYKSGLGGLDLFLLNDDIKVSFGVDYIKAVMTTQEPDKYVETYMQTIQIENKEKKQNFEFINLLVPKSADDDRHFEVLINDKNEGKEIIIISADFKEKFIIAKNKEQIFYENIKD